MRGENAIRRHGFTDQRGSPPHAWGKSGNQCLCHIILRFTPTCVGKICNGRLSVDSLSVHPHMRGENNILYFSAQSETGSPPHAWGKSVPSPAKWWCARFTPTCVGKIKFGLSPSKYLSVHPHMRGENYPKHPIAPVPIGSPPHAWGKSWIIFNGIGDYRFTPTCVGKICTIRSPILAFPVHPHMRGENSPVK